MLKVYLAGEIHTNWRDEIINDCKRENLDIKLYLLSILIEMDSAVKVDLMVRTMMNDPNTSDEIN